MKKTIALIIIVSFLIANKYYAITSINIPFFNKPKGYVRIDFINNSDEKISKIVFNNRNIMVKNIAVNKRKTVLVKNKPVNNLGYTVYYSDGKIIKSNGAFIESGYFIKEYILNYTTRIEQTNL